MPRKYIRKTGEAARALPSSYRRRLRGFRAVQAARLGMSSLSIPQLKLAMQAPFTWETLKRALAGKALRADNCQFIEEFLDRHAPERVAAAGQDQKTLAAGGREPEEQSEESRVAEFLRRGRDAQDAVDEEVIHRGSR